MKQARNIVVKTLFNPDEYLSFDAKCVSSDVSHSKALRDLAKGWMTQRNDIRRRRQSDRTEYSQNMAIVCPSKSNFGAVPQMRRHL